MISAKALISAYVLHGWKSGADISLLGFTIGECYVTDDFQEKLNKDSYIFFIPRKTS